VVDNILFQKHYAMQIEKLLPHAKGSSFLAGKVILCRYSNVTNV
jgi:hypothetical protein